MTKLILAFAALLAAPTAALACSCLNTDDPAELQQFALDVAQGAVALVEIETIRGYDHALGSGEEAQIIRTLAGSAEGRFTIERGKFPDEASCDDLLQPTQKKLLILYPSSKAGVYRVSDLCTNLLLEKPVFRDAVAASIGKGERG